MKKKINLCTTDIDLPDGTYEGRWSASTLVITTGKEAIKTPLVQIKKDIKITVKTKHVVKGINIPVDVIIRSKQVVDIESAIV